MFYVVYVDDDYGWFDIDKAIYVKFGTIFVKYVDKLLEMEFSMMSTK